MFLFYGKLYVFYFWSAFVRDHVSCQNVSTINWRHDLTTLSLLYNTSAINRIWILRIFAKCAVTKPNSISTFHLMVLFLW